MSAEVSGPGVLGGGVRWRVPAAMRRSGGQRRAVDLLQELESGPLRALQDGLAALARGDLTVVIECDLAAAEAAAGDELSRAVGAFYGRLAGCVQQYDRTRRALQGTIGEVSESAAEVFALAHDIAAGSAQ
jgi:methyl-accepting chemotaxis protein